MAIGFHMSLGSKITYDCAEYIISSRLNLNAVVYGAAFRRKSFMTLRNHKGVDIFIPIKIHRIREQFFLNEK